MSKENITKFLQAYRRIHMDFHNPAYLMPGENELDWQDDENYVKFSLPKVEAYDVLVIKR